MEWLLQKAIDSAGQSYSPQQVAEMLDSHAEAIRLLGFFCTALLFLWLATTIYAILASFKLRAIQKGNRLRIKKLEK